MMSTKIKRALRIAVRAYLSGAVVIATYLVWSALDGGALERQHPDWVIALLGFTAYVVFWPIVLGVLLLQVLGVFRGPFEW
jgi:hypothetical protein